MPELALAEVTSQGSCIPAVLDTSVSAQVWPDAEHEPRFPQSILHPGETYVHKWFLHFYTKPAGAANAPAPGQAGAAVGSAIAPEAGKVKTASIP